MRLRPFIFLAALLSLWGLTPARAATYNTILTVNAGASNTGKATQILATIYDNTHTALVSASNSPGGVAFAESSVTPGSYWAAFAVDTTKLPLTVEFSPLSNGTQFSMFQVGNDRSALNADGYTAALASKTNTALPSAAPATAGGLLTVGTGTGQLNPSGGSLTAASVTTVSTGTAQAGGASTITLQAGEASTTDIYKGDFVVITGGAGYRQSRVITGYVGGTLVATVSRPWTVNPDSTSTYAIIANPHPAMDSNLAVTAGTVSDKVGYALTQAFPSNFSTLAIDGSGRVTPNDSTGTTTLLTRLPQALLFDGSGNVKGIVYAYNTSLDPGTLVLDAAASGHNTAGTVGNKINSAGSAGDPWGTASPGSYSPGTFGYVVSHNLDAQVSTRFPTSSYTAAPTTSQIAAVILSNPSNLIATDGSGNVSLSTTTVQAIRDSVWAKVIDGSLSAQDVLVLDAANIAGNWSNSWNGTTHILTTTYKRQDGTTVANTSATTYTSSTTTPPAVSRTNTNGTLP